MSRWNDFYNSFAEVIRSVPEGAHVLDSPLLPSSSIDVQVDSLLDTPAEESITSKFRSGAYTVSRHEDSSAQNILEGPTLLFHDLKLAFARVFAELSLDSPEYNTASDLFKFAVDLFMREAHRLDLLLNREPPEGDLAEGDDYLFRVSQGFQTIRTEIQDWNGETFWVTAANGPLFVSSSNKAPVDPRQTQAAGSVHTARLLPHIARAPESTLGFVSPLNPRYPQPNFPPTDLLGRFGHPNSQSTIAPIWITGQDAYSSFAPTVDSAGAVVGDADVAGVWVERASERPKRSFTHLDAEDLRAGAKPSSLPPSHFQSPQPHADPLVSDQEQDTSPPDFSDPAHSAENEDLETVDINDVDLQSLLRWTPYNFIDNDEIEAAANGTERELLSRLLLELQYLQRERLATPGTELEVGDGERHIALKTQNILSRLVEGSKSESIALQLDTRLPVLMRNYAGSLPAAMDPSLHAPFPPPQPGPQRLQNLGQGSNGFRQSRPSRPSRALRR